MLALQATGWTLAPVYRQKGRSGLRWQDVPRWANMTALVQPQLKTIPTCLPIIPPHRISRFPSPPNRISPVPLSRTSSQASLRVRKAATNPVGRRNPAKAPPVTPRHPARVSSAPIKIRAVLATAASKGRSGRANLLVSRLGITRTPIPGRRRKMMTNRPLPGVHRNVRIRTSKPAPRSFRNAIEAAGSAGPSAVGSVPVLSARLPRKPGASFISGSRAAPSRSAPP